jgi:hypothetical protein
MLHSATAAIRIKLFIGASGSTSRKKYLWGKKRVAIALVAWTPGGVRYWTTMGTVVECFMFPLVATTVTV